MMSADVRSEEFDVDTHGRLVTDITGLVERFASGSNDDGLLHIFLPHATAGLALMETGSGSEQDLEEVVERIVPRDDRYRHRHGPGGHGGDHLLPTLIPPTVTLAVESGRLVLGTWQRVVIVDPNRENNRRRVQLRHLQG